MASRRLLLVLLLGASCAAAAWLWNGTPVRRSTDKPAATAALAPGQADLAAAAGVDPTTLLVDFRDDVSQATLDGNGLVEESLSDYSAVDRLYRVHFPNAAAAAAARERLLRDPSVEAVDWEAQAFVPPDEGAVLADEGTAGECEAKAGDVGAADRGFPNDPCFRYQWHMAQLGLPAAWKLGQGEGAVVAVIDTGVTQVPDLAQTKLVKGWNFVANSANAADDHGHGTHVAGTIAQATNNKLGVSGVAFKAAIMPLKVLSAQGSGSVGAIAQAIRWAGDHGAHVINMSLGGPFPAKTMESAVRYARGKGVTVIAAAGNDGRGKVGYPAAYPGVIAVAATQFDETTTFYSNWGPEVDIAGPGGNTRVDQNGDGKPDGVLQNTVVPGNITKTDYLWFMGTSMASPHVAGVAALIVGAGITKPDAVEAVLTETARKPKNPGQGTRDGGVKPVRRFNDHYGAGLADAGAALKKARRGRAAEEMGLGAVIAGLALAAGRRRRAALGLGGMLGLGVALAGATSLGFSGAGAALFGPAGQGNPLVWSALAPVALAGLLYGVRRAHPALAGFAFGMAGALLFAALSDTMDIRFIPDALDRPWLLAHAALSAALGALILRRS